jgi:hypothetical protein
LRESIDCPFVRDFHCWIFMILQHCIYEQRDSLCFWVQALTSSVDADLL